MFFTRLASSIILVIAAVALLLSGGYALLAVLLILGLIAYRELMKACSLSGEFLPIGEKKDDHKKWHFSGLEIIGYLGIASYYLVLLFTGAEVGLFVTLLIVLIAFMFLYVLRFPKYRADQVMCAYFNVIYAPVMLSCIYLVRELPYGNYLVWMIFISSWICDTCAYVVGMLFGKHKLVPQLSPKKSVEGAIGGVVGSAIVGGLFAYFVVEQVVTEQSVILIFIIVSAIGAMISQIGDLAASAIKRNHDIKDYGKLIPGHGGVMDRFDSVIFTAPMVYLLLEILIHV